MSTPEAFTVVKETIDDAWETTPVFYENDRIEPPANRGAFVVVEMRGLDYDQASIGAEPQSQNLWREHGLLQIHVMVPKNSGSLIARTYAKTLGNLFRGQDIDGVVFHEQRRGAAEPRADDGNFWRFTVEIEWYRDEP